MLRLRLMLEYRPKIDDVASLLPKRLLLAEYDAVGGYKK